MEKDFGAKEFDIDWDNYIVLTVRFASTKEKAINEERETLIKKVKECFEIFFENMNRCKGDEGQAHHQIHQIIINKM